MRGYDITELSSKTQQLIKQNNLDRNQDGRINEDNGELAELLSQTGKKDIKELLNDSWWDKKGEDNFVASWFGLGGIALGLSSILKKADLNLDNVKYFTQREINDIVDYNKIQKAYGYKTKPVPNYDEIYNKHLKTALKGVKQVKTFKIITGLLSLCGLAASAYMLLRKPEEKNIQMVDDAPKNEMRQFNNEWEEKYSKAFGGDTPLVEYVPEKGEYWISILKAKYGVNDDVAQKMANKIKEMIYDNAKAAKQTPIMYLPETWTFEGKSYTYNKDAVPAKTSDYSDEVKTEQGKMTKDLKYE